MYASFQIKPDVRHALQNLLSAIKSGRHAPFFERGEIDRLFTDEVLKVFGGGRYHHTEKLDSIANWADLLGNTAAPAIANRNYLKKDKKADSSDRKEALRDLQNGLRRFKIIEDWIYYHPETQQQIARLIS